MKDRRWPVPNGAAGFEMYQDLIAREKALEKQAQEAAQQAAQLDGERVLMRQRRLGVVYALAAVAGVPDPAEHALSFDGLTFREIDGEAGKLKLFVRNEEGNEEENAATGGGE